MEIFLFVCENNKYSEYINNYSTLSLNIESWFENSSSILLYFQLIYIAVD